ncbi:MAG: hypothetical protein ACK5L5_11180 [Bacteroidales bacterium]
MKKIFAFFLVFLYLFNIDFVFIPSSLKTRMFIGCLFFISLFFSNEKLKIDRLTGGVLIFSFLLFVIAFISASINLQSDFWLVQFAILTLLYFAASKFTARNISEILNHDIHNAYKLIVYVILFHNVIAFLGIIVPGLMELIIGMQGGGREAYSQYMIDSRLRSYGFGEGQFFVGGIMTGFGLILQSYLMKMKKMNVGLGMIIYLLILATGIFIARTSIVGAICSMLFIIPTKRMSFKIAVKSIYGLLFLVLTTGAIVIYLINNEIVDVSWAFGFFELGFNDPSLQQLSQMYNTYPETLKTWVIGDAYFMDPSGGSYYMHTDVGWIRIIFCGGILYLILFFLFHRYLAKHIVVNGSNFRNDVLLALAFVILLFAGNMKGFTNLLPYMFLLLMLQLECKKTKKDESYSCSL